MYTYTYISVCIYIYIERERERNIGDCITIHGKSTKFQVARERQEGGPSVKPSEPKKCWDNFWEPKKCWEPSVKPSDAK